MNTYQLEITVTKPFTSARDTLYRNTVDAANAIEMRWSEYFKWEDDAQESLSRSSAIKYAEEEIQSYHSNVRENLWWRITTWQNGHKLDGYFGHARRVDA
jgi:hypothetical protein